MIVGAGKNGMELYKVMKDDLSYGFNILGFFDDNLSLKSVLPNYLGMTNEVESFVLANDVDEIYCTLPGTNDEKIRTPAEFCRETHDPLLYRAGILSKLEEESCDGGLGVHSFNDCPPRAFAGGLQPGIETLRLIFFFQL